MNLPALHLSTAVYGAVMMAIVMTLRPLPKAPALEEGAYRISRRSYPLIALWSTGAISANVVVINVGWNLVVTMFSSTLNVLAFLSTGLLSIGIQSMLSESLYQTVDVQLHTAVLNITQPGRTRVLPLDQISEVKYTRLRSALSVSGPVPTTRKQLWLSCHLTRSRFPHLSYPAAHTIDARVHRRSPRHDA